MESSSYRLDLDPEQLRLYGGHINTRLITLRRATESEASSLSPSTPDSIILYKSYIESGLKLPLTPLVRGILAYFDLAPCQVNPNFYRAISVASAAIPHLSPDLVLTPELFANCYKLGFCRRSGNGTPLGLFVISRHLDVAVPDWSLPRSEERWMHDPFVATGKCWQGQGRSRSPQIRCAPNRCVDFVRPPPLLSGKYATAFELMRRGRNSAFEKFLKRSVAQDDGAVASPSQEAVGKRRKLSRVSSDNELPSHAPATTTIEKPKIRRGILQRKRKAKEDETKASYQPTVAKNSKPSDAASAPKILSSITVCKIDSGLTRRQIGQRRRYARKKQSIIIKESKPKGKPTVVASPSSTKLPPTSTLETALKEKDMIVASQSSTIPAPLTSNTEPHKSTGATIPIERYEAVLPSVPNCPVSPNTQTDLLTPVSILTQNSSTSLNDQTTIPPLEVIILKGMAEEETSAGSNKKRLEVLFDANGLPIGKYSHKLSTKVGQLVQTHLPIGFKTWKKVPAAKKNGIWEKLKMDFILPKSYKEICLKSMAAKWRKRKSNLMKAYIDPCRSNDERLRNLPPQIKKEDWEKFVEFSTSRQMMELRRRNANSRKHLDMYHRTGRDGLARLAEKMRVEGDGDVNRTTVYLKSRAKKGESDSYSEDVLPRAKRLMTLLETQSQEENNDLETDPLTQVFGPDNKGRMRGVSTHVSRSRYRGSIAAKEKLDEVEDQNRELKGKLGQLEVDMHEMKDNMGYMTEEMKSWKSTWMNHVGADGFRQMHGTSSEKSPPSKGQSFNTDTVQGKSASRKSTTPSSINGTTEQKCEVLDWRRNLVATGRVHRDPNQTTCHGLPFNKEEEVVVIVDIIHNGEAELYAPGSFANILSDVGIGGTIKWHVSGIRYV